MVASLSTLGMVCFIPSLQLTSVSNVAIIIATGPFVAAAFALDMACARPRAGKPCWRASWRSAASRSSSAIPAQFRFPRDRPGLPHDCCDRGDDRHIRTHKHTPMVAAGGIVELPRQRCQHSLRPFDRRRNGKQPVRSGDVRVLSGRAGAFPVYAGLPHAAIRAATLIATLETPLMPFWSGCVCRGPAAGFSSRAPWSWAPSVFDIVGDLRAQRKSG